MVRLVMSPSETERKVESEPIRVRMRLQKGVQMTAYIKFVGHVTENVSRRFKQAMKARYDERRKLI
jgi:hypothetical protein